MLERDGYLRALIFIIVPRTFIWQDSTYGVVVKYEGVSLAKLSGNNTLTLNLSPVTNLARREGTVYTFGAV